MRSTDMFSITGINDYTVTPKYLQIVYAVSEDITQPGLPGINIKFNDESCIYKNVLFVLDAIIQDRA